MIPSARAHLHVNAITHPGMLGKSNEDRFAVSAHQVSQTSLTPSLLAIIADGVGGHRAGEVAAEMAVEAISRFVAESDASQPPQILAQAMAAASRLIFEQSHRDLAHAGMGTTAVCAWIIADRLYITSAGDSRIYLLRDHRLQCLTIDHTWVQEALDHGALSQEGARDHPNAHVIRRYLGAKHPLRADLRLRLHSDESDAQAEANQGMQLLPGDQLLMCSDGLTDLVNDAEILTALSTGDPINEKLNGLVALANECGGHDNITILVLEMPARSPAKESQIRPRRPVRSILILLGLLSTLLLLTWLGWYLLQPGGQAGDTPTPSPSLSTPIFDTQLKEIITPQAYPAKQTSEPRARSLPSATPIPVTHTPWPTNTLPP